MRGSVSELLVVILIMAVFLLIFGVKKIPELAKALKESHDILVTPEETATEQIESKEGSNNDETQS